jgi:stringent starvation protein B
LIDAPGFKVETQQASTRPYLLRAMHEWMTDTSQTPLVVVDAVQEGVQVPPGHVKDGRIVLNIAWSATRNLQMTNDLITFDARFGGVAHSVMLPIRAVLGIYARESGQGMMFQDEPALAGQSASPAAAKEKPAAVSDAEPPRPKPGGPGLRLVK